MGMCDWLAIDVMSCVLRDQVRLYDGLLSAGGIPEDAQKFFAWGSPDLVVMSRFPGVDQARGIYHRQTDNGIFDRQVYYGHVIGGTQRPLKQITDRLPLVGISFLKVKSHIIKRLPSSSLGFAAYGWLNERLQSQILPRIERKLPGFVERDFEYVLCAASGWADVILVCFSTSYAPMQLVLSHLRRTRVKDVLKHYGVEAAETPECPHHALVTTCTIPGTHVAYPARSRGGRELIAAQRLRRKLAKWDNVTSAAIAVHAKPGHLNNAMSQFPGGKGGTVATFGRADFVEKPLYGRSSGVLEHHHFFITDLLPKTQDRISSIGWTETRIGFSGQIFRAEPGPRPDPKTRTTQSKSGLNVPVWNDKRFRDVIPLHTGGALKQIGLSLASLIEHEATCEFYESLAVCYEVACRNAVELAERLTNTDTEVAGSLSGSLGQFCERLDLCFKDRYRGSYPAGSMSAVPSLTSQASFHTTLSVIDDLANSVLDAVYENLWKLAQNGSKKRYRRFAACCHLGNSSVPQVDVLPRLGVGFINVPTELMFAPEGMAYILHETGHVFWHTLIPQLGHEVRAVIDKNDPSVYRFVEDVLCDFVVLAAAFRGDAAAMHSEVCGVLAGLLPPPSLQEGEEIMIVRSACADALWRTVSSGGNVAQRLDDEKRAIRALSGKRRKGSQRPWFLGSSLIGTFSTMVQKSEPFLWMLQAVRELGSAKSANGIIDPLSEIQTFFATPSDKRNREEFIYRLRQVQSIAGEVRRGTYSTDPVI